MFVAVRYEAYPAMAKSISLVSRSYHLARVRLQSLGSRVRVARLRSLHITREIDTSLDPVKLICSQGLAKVIHRLPYPITYRA